MNSDKLQAHLEQEKLYLRLKSQASYRSRIRAAVRALWTSEWDIFQFFDEMNSVIDSGFDNAWGEGMKVAGLSFADITPEEQMELANFKISERQFIFGFGEAVEAGSKENGGKLGPLFSRVELWVQRWQAVKSRALSMAQSDGLFEWVLSAQESCTSCLKLQGQTRRLSVWQRLDIRPQHPRKLECEISSGGITVCKCSLVPSQGPSSRGRLPSLP